MNKYEAALEACLQALQEGSADVASCLARYPEHAEALRPHLFAATKLMSAFDGAQPSARFAAKARERFLIASGQRLEEAFEADPTPSFFAAARVRFLMTAQRMKLGERSPSQRRLPVFGSPMRAFTSTAAALVVLVGISGYTVASASAAVPGDWDYGVKLQTERVRLALAFTEGAEQDVRLDIAEERVEEIEKLTARGEIIGPGVINRLKDQTQPLANVSDDHIARAQAIVDKSRIALSEAEPQIAPEAAPILAETQAFVLAASRDLSVRAVNGGLGPAVLTPQIPFQTPEPDDTPPPTVTPTSTPPQLGDTPVATPTAVATKPARTGLEIDPTPVGIAQGVTWIRIAVGDFSTLIPSPADGWAIAGVQTADGSSAAPALIRVYNADGTQIITLNPRNGDVYWFVAIGGGVFDEVQLRITRDGQTLVADRELITRLYGPIADIPLYVLDHIEFTPAVVPTAQPSTTPESSATPE